jgi:hypothetical protein
MPVVDCPDHPMSALKLDAGTFCFGCQRAVVDRHLLGHTTTEPSAELLAEAHAAFKSSRTVAAFAIEAQLDARGMISTAPDARRSTA